MKIRALALLLSTIFLATEGLAQQPPSPGQLGLVPSNPNQVQVLDSSSAWSTVGTIDPVTHIFTPNSMAANITVGASRVLGGFNGCLLSINVQTLGCLSPGLGVFSTHADLIASLATPVAPNTVSQLGYHYAGEPGGQASYDWNATSLAAADGTFVLLPSGQSSGTPGRYLLRVPSGGLHPEVGGAYCDLPLGSAPNGTTSHDDTVAMNAFIAALGATGGGTIVQTVKATACDFHTGDLLMAQNVTLQGAFYPFQDNRDKAEQNIFPMVSVLPPFRVKLAHGSALRDFMVIREGLPSHEQSMEAIANFQNVLLTDDSIGIDNNSANASNLVNVAPIGFATGIKQDGGGKMVTNNVFGDNGTTMEIGQIGDTYGISNVHTNNMYTRDWAGWFSTYDDALISGGNAYLDGDLLTVPGGNCADVTAPVGVGSQPVLRANVAGGGPGAITSFTISDTGGCKFANTTRTSGSPQDWGITAASSVNSGGTYTGSDGPTVVTITDSDCDPANLPSLNATITGGVLASTGSVVNAGSCNYKQQITVDPVTTVDGLLTGAKINVVSQKNPISLTGGHGTGATATISTQPVGYRPGAGIYVHGNSTSPSLGLRIYNLETEQNQWALLVDNVADLDVYTYGGEGGKGNEDRKTIGIELRDCVKQSRFYNGYFGTQFINYNALNRPDGCPAGETRLANPVFAAGNNPLISGYTYSGFLAGPGSQGLITGGLTISPNNISALGGESVTLGNGNVLLANATVNAIGSGYTASAKGTMTYSGSECSVKPVFNVTTNSSGQIATATMDTNNNTSGTCAESALPPSTATTWTPSGIGAGTGASFFLSWQGAGQWRLANLSWTGGANQPPTPTSQWLYVDPYSVPPIDNDLAWTGDGSLVANGDMLFDQVGAGAAHQSTGTLSSALTIDGWRYAASTAVARRTFAQVNNGRMQPYAESLQLTIITPDTLANNTKNYFLSNIEGPDSGILNANVAGESSVVDFCAKASITGTYDMFFSTPGHHDAFIYPFVATPSATCYSFVLPPFPTTVLTASALAFQVGFDMGSGTNFETATTMQWINSSGSVAGITRTADAVKLATNSAATFTFGPVHIRPGPWIATYHPMLYRDEATYLRARFRKSFTNGQAVAQGSVGTPIEAGAATTIAPVTNQGVYIPVWLDGMANLSSNLAATFYNTTAADANCYDKTAGADLGTAIAINPGTHGFSISCPAAGGLPNAGDQVQVQWSYDSGM